MLVASTNSWDQGLAILALLAVAHDGGKANLSCLCILVTGSSCWTNYYSSQTTRQNPSGWWKRQQALIERNTNTIAGRNFSPENWWTLCCPCQTSGRSGPETWGGLRSLWMRRLINLRAVFIGMSYISIIEFLSRIPLGQTALNPLKGRHETPGHLMARPLAWTILWSPPLHILCFQAGI